jgi:cytosine/adenosine deaminase-related metal-dependent hydrolase
MRLALLMARAQRTQTFPASNKYPQAMLPTVQHAFQLATSRAARAVRMPNDVGSLRVGFKAIIESSTLDSERRWL